MFDPDVVILGGRIAELKRLYLNVPRKWPGYSLNEGGETKLLQASKAVSHLLWLRARPA